jgi:hypothetical protein
MEFKQLPRIAREVPCIRRVYKTTLCTPALICVVVISHLKLTNQSQGRVLKAQVSLSSKLARCEHGVRMTQELLRGPICG